MKRILALDGGGIRGVFTLEVLLKIEKVLRAYYAKQDPEKAKTFVLRDHFDFLAGTSTGAIIATCLCWGMSAEKVKNLYIEQGRKMFELVSWRHPVRKLFSRYDPKPISDFLQGLFLEDDGKIATLASPRLRDGEKKNFLMVVVRNHTNGSAWPLTNNPDAIYNDPTRPDDNRQIPLWQLVRASTAAPLFFPPEKVRLGDTESIFVDGSITPYSNPALIAALTAILPGYHMDWPTGPDKIHVVSVGTLAFSSELTVSNPSLWLGALAAKIPAALLQSMGWQQDYLCRCLGECIFGEVLDGEVGYLVDALDAANKDEKGKLKIPVWRPRPAESWFKYVRYNRSFKKAEMQQILREHRDLASISAVGSIPRLIEVGQQYAAENVKLEHLV
jgi:patatin-like phospholipase/acyl hydrolase